MELVVPRNKRIYMGCAGPAEFEYTRWLQYRLDQIESGICFFARNLGGGSISRMLNIATADRKRQAKIRDFVGSYLLLDRNRIKLEETTFLQELALSAKVRFKVIWEVPCVEAFQLKHDDSFFGNEFKDSDDALAQYRVRFKTVEHLDLYQLINEMPTDLQALWKLCQFSEGLDDLLNQLIGP